MHGQHVSHCRNWHVHYWCLQMDQRRSPMVQWTQLRSLSYFCSTEPAPAPRWTKQEGSSVHEKLCAANPVYLSCSRGACQESSLPEWSHVWEDTATRLAITNWLGVGEDRRNQEWLQKPLQVQEGCSSVHRPLLLWGRMCQLTLIYSNIKVPRHDPWEFVKLSRDQDVLIEWFK